MPRASKYFKLVDPRFPNRGLSSSPGLSRLLAEAAVGFVFEHFPASDEEATKLLAGCSLGDFDDGVEAARLLLVQGGRAPSKADNVSLDVSDVGASLVDVFCDRHITKMPPYTGRLRSGKTIKQRQVLCAMALYLVERTASALRRNDSKSVAALMRDQLEVICEVRRALDREAGATIAARRARSRWAVVYETRARAIQLYEANESKWKSRRAASQRLVSDVQRIAKSLGWTMSEDRAELTLYGWLLTAKKRTPARQA